MTMTAILSMGASLAFVLGISLSGVVIFGSWAYGVLHDLM